MSNETTFTNRLAKLPVAILPTCVGAITLSNVFANPLGFPWVRHFTIWVSIIIWFCYLLKIILCFNTCLDEYQKTVPASLYAGFTMIMMLVGAYLFDYVPWLGKGIWLIAIIIHALHILIFTYKNVLKGVNIKTFVPSWFVTYNGIMVSCVVGAPMNMPELCSIIVYYGIAVLILIMPFMIYRLLKFPIEDGFYHTRAIVLAPSSLCVVSYINIISNPIPLVIYILYFIVFCCLVFVVINIKKFFSFKFHPGFAGLTFPMSIGIVASLKTGTFLTTLGFAGFGTAISQLAGFQIYMTTAIIAFVLHNFYVMFSAKTHQILIKKNGKT